MVAADTPGAGDSPARVGVDVEAEDVVLVEDVSVSVVEGVSAVDAADDILAEVSVFSPVPSSVATSLSGGLGSSTLSFDFAWS